MYLCLLSCSDENDIADEELEVGIQITTYEDSVCYDHYRLAINPYVNPNDTVHIDTLPRTCVINRVQIIDSAGMWLRFTSVTPWSRSIDTLFPVLSNIDAYEYYRSYPRDAMQYKAELSIMGDSLMLRDELYNFHWESGTLQSYDIFRGEGVLHK